jgi:hypothetical protein
MSAATDRLELDRNEAFQRKEWTVQRVGWVVWGIVIVAALAGLLGSGPLSDQVASSADGAVRVHYDRFVHHHHPTILEVHLRPKSGDGKELAIKLSQPFLDRVRIHHIQPDAERRELLADGAVFYFDRDDRAETAKIVLHVEYEKMGATRGRVELLGHDGVDLRSFVYP